MCQKGDFVRKRNNPGIAATIVDGPINDAGDVLWRVRLPDGSVRKWQEGTFEIVPEAETIADLMRRRIFGRKIDFSQLLTFHRLVQPLSNNIYSLHTNRIQFLPYQFKPLLKFIDSPNQRLLIADDVGLGKTIEAGLILSELKVRTSLQTVLVACPSHLREKWRMEMRSRFGEEFQILDSAGFRSFLKDYRDASGHLSARIICSIQSMRSERVADEMERVDPRFDLIIVDEAHHMRNRSARNTFRMGQLLSRQAEAMIFLTATPVQTQLENLFNLLHLLDAEHFQDYGLFERQLEANSHVLRAEAALASVPPDIDKLREAVDAIEGLPVTQRKWFVSNPLWVHIRTLAKSMKLPVSRRELVSLRYDLGEMNLLGDSLTRTRKVDVMTGAHREPQVLQVTYTAEESQLNRLILNYVRSKYGMCGSFFEKAALMMPQRRAASSIIGSARFYLRGGGDADLEDYIASLDDGSVELPDDLQDTSENIQSLFERAAAAKMPDSKYAVLLEFLRTLQRREKVIIFSTFPSTLEYLQERLRKDDFEGVVISGQVLVEERLLLVEKFRDSPNTRILLSSEVGGEGLDLQFCSIVVNFDLPWNPMAVAQRIGRVDRIGQRSPVIRIINLAVKDTIDQLILERLYMRIGLFTRCVGLTDGILGNVLESIADALLSDDLSEEARMEKVEHEAQALETRVLMVEQMNTKSEGVFISDSFLQDEVNRANKLHRYVSDEELHTLVTEFLGKYYPRTIRVKVAEHPMTYRMDPDSALKLDLNSFPFGPGDRRPAFLNSKEPSIVTFDVETASRNSCFEHINLNHPLVRLVVQYYRDHGHEFARTTFFSLRSNTVPPGYYVAVIHKLIAEGVRPRVILLPAVIDLSTQAVMDEDVSEILVAEMITKARDVSHLKVAPSDLPLMEAYQKAGDTLAERDRVLRASLRKKDQAFRSRRVASIRSYYDRRIERQKTLADDHQGRSSGSATVKGFLTRVKNLEQELEMRISEIEQGKPFDPETEEILGAVVHVLEQETSS